MRSVLAATLIALILLYLESKCIGEISSMAASSSLDMLTLDHDIGYIDCNYGNSSHIPSTMCNQTETTTIPHYLSFILFTMCLTSPQIETEFAKLREPPSELELSDQF
jgi:hypothetical protein